MNPCTHVYHRRLNVTTQDIACYRTLLNYLLCLYRSGSFKTLISPLSRILLDNLSTLSFVPGLLQAYTCCRFNELDQIGVHIIKTNSPFIIKSSKSDHIRSIRRLPLQREPQLRNISSASRILIVSYDSYKNSIKKSKNRFDIFNIKGILDCTHIWRHLEASWMAEQKIPIAEISYRMGHLCDQTTLQYIHEELYPSLIFL